MHLTTDYGRPVRKLPKVKSQSQIFRYSRSIFCLPHWPNFSDFFDLCLHWVSVVRASNLDAPIKANHAYFLVFAQWGQPLYYLEFRFVHFRYFLILYIENLENIL